MLLCELKRNHRATPECVARELQVLKWRDTDKMTFTEIGERLGITKSNARQIYYRAARHHVHDQQN